MDNCFNPRPHAAGDPPGIVYVYKIIDVSIHARTRRATWKRGCPFADLQ